MIDVRKAAEDLAALSVLKFFPSDDVARTAILGIVCGMAENNEQVRWLVKRTIALHNEWPGPKELRAVFCSRHKPKDGINAYSAIYVDGVPPEKPLALDSKPLAALPPGAVVSADPAMDEAIQKLAAAKTMPPARIGNDEFTRQLEEVLTPPHERPESPPAISESRRRELQAAIDEELRKAGRL